MGKVLEFRNTRTASQKRSSGLDKLIQELILRAQQEQETQTQDRWPDGCFTLNPEEWGK